MPCCAPFLISHVGCLSLALDRPAAINGRELSVLDPAGLEVEVASIVSGPVVAIMAQFCGAPMLSA
ncbi:MAG: hypothetical protein ABI833_13630 [Acidobacteriota bacterium]